MRGIKVELLVNVNDKMYEISELVTSISYTDKLNDGCSKLEFSYIDDKLTIENGSSVRFKYDNKNIFSGIAFSHRHTKDKEIAVTAYDQLRYCKAKDEIVVLKDTATTLTKRMCNYFGLRAGTLTDTKYVLATGVQDGKTWLDIVYDGISETLMNTGKKFCLRDEFGAISLRNLEDLKLNLILGDDSLCYDFNYEKSIDDEFYNRIKIYVKGDKGKNGQFIVEDSNSSIKKYGLLQYFESLDKEVNISQVKAKAKALLGLYNQEVESLSLECLGDTSVRAGSTFYVLIEGIELFKPLFVKSVTHKFLPNHTMSLEVAIS
ncbi:XkdQ/YqbQ family protein [Anaerocolumna aminovalerica]|uniref:XkdQ/YqbQ family protein n=1 Tax=Anaerocolumna aminovalerica TaxID=1527 RepID=UPI00209E8B43|nr:hypothetical protein [Anaerocolumna aminovalerica]